ncbi:MAG: hypothetical protein N3B12_06365 [Armatimonadetes bacterium]|nr:hypothetical protein [Armatimonadota bacterium]
MRIHIAFCFWICLLTTATGELVKAQDIPPTPPPMIGPRLGSSRSLKVGPKDITNLARKIRGKTTLAAVLPENVVPNSVEFQVDGRFIGSSKASPFQVEFDTTTVSDGPHLIKAIGRDDTNKEVWSAFVKVEITNSARPPASSPVMGPRVGSNVPNVPSQPSGINDVPGRSEVSDSATSPQNLGGSMGMSEGDKPAFSSSSPLPVGLSLDSVYESGDYGFSIRYPGMWTFRDQTAAMKPKSRTDFWVQFGSDPIEKTPIVINIRRVKLQEGTDARRFAKYNAYVKSWQAKTVLGSPAFSTTSRVLRPKPAIIHRLIIIKKGHAWMLNCTDYTGGSPKESLALFESIVASIKETAIGP